MGFGQWGDYRNIDYIHDNRRLLYIGIGNVHNAGKRRLGDSKDEWEGITTFWRA